MIAKIKEFNPKIAVFNGKGIYEVFSGQKEFIFGKQPEKIRDTETVQIFLLTYIFSSLIQIQYDCTGACSDIKVSLKIL